MLNLYSARHYQTDEALYDNFTKATGIKINRIEAGDEQLLERMTHRGGAEPRRRAADRRRRAPVAAQQHGPVPAGQVGGAGRAHPRGVARPRRRLVRLLEPRAGDRLQQGRPSTPPTFASYESLADAKNKGRVCTRSGSHPYNLSLVAALIDHLGEAGTEKWARGVVANMARTPRGGDTDQIKAVAAGECGVALTNTYYYVRLMRSTKPEEREWAAKVGLVWPDQASYGTHLNVAGAGVLKHAPHPENARRFLEYLASDEAQAYFANGNNEWPAVKGAVAKNPELESLGSFKADPLPIAVLGRNTPAAQKLLDRAGWK